MNAPQNNNFIDSLEHLTGEDLAPKPEKRRSISNPVGRGLWLTASILLFGVAIWSSSKVVGNVIDFIRAEENYSGMAGEFSPITGVFDRPANLKTGKDSYPLPGFDDLFAGNVSYPDDDEQNDLPVVNPGIDPSPVFPSDEPSDEPTKPDDKPIVEEDPLLSADIYDEFCNKLTAMQSEYNNEDIFAWIYLPGSNINYPIVRGSDNDFYLNHEPTKQWNNAGSIFLDYRNDKNLLNNPYSVIYGHNIRTRGTMFNRLTSMTSEENFLRYRYVYIYTKEAALKYEIFSVFSCEGKKGPTIAIPKGFDASFLTKIEDIKARSLFQRGDLTLSKTDHVITMYTCANTTSSTERVFVSAVLVGIGRS